MLTKSQKAACYHLIAALWMAEELEDEARDILEEN